MISDDAPDNTVWSVPKLERDRLNKELSLTRDILLFNQRVHD